MFGIVLKVIQRTKKKLRQDLEASMKVCNSVCVCSRSHGLWLRYRCGSNIVVSQEKTEPTFRHVLNAVVVCDSLLSQKCLHRNLLNNGC